MATETFSQNFKRIFLLTFTKELIIHSAKIEMSKLQNIIESKEQGRTEKIPREPSLIFTRESNEIKSFQKITTPIQRTYEMSDTSDMPTMPSVYPARKILTREMDEEPSINLSSNQPLRLPPKPLSKPPMRQFNPAPPMRQIESTHPMRQIDSKSPIKPPARQGIRYPLFIPEPQLPSHLEYLKPIPTPGVEIDLFKLNSLIKDPAIRIIEVNQDERVIVGGTMGTMPVDIILNKEDIDRVVNKFSEVSKIPITEGIYKIIVGNLVLSAIVSEEVNSKFIIKKMLAPKSSFESQQQNQQQKPQTLPFQDEDLT